ncbi:hypothetical protein AG1IA_03201 [Rhizoctonia solani AG-1 IA]|uniref:Uncharacterized protein n=1 Tax=Thanatephorus cucumeris (strain AG1-IA) TaxID=983506 RepID=L8X2E5_THACA|nr:hypothetical protein AG1IA_03201 [Rhizoctonia solani AG-1 IA]
MTEKFCHYPGLAADMDDRGPVLILMTVNPIPTNVSVYGMYICDSVGDNVALITSRNTHSIMVFRVKTRRVGRNPEPYKVPGLIHAPRDGVTLRGGNSVSQGQRIHSS